MDDSDLLAGQAGDSAQRRKANGMVTAQYDGHGTCRCNVANGIRDLIECLLDVRWNGEHIPGIAHRHLFSQVHAHLKVIWRVKGGNSPHTLRSEAGSRPVRGTSVKRYTQHRRIIFAYILHILHVRRLHEGVDTGEMRQLIAGKGRNAPVFNARGSRQPFLQGFLNFLGISLVGDVLLFV